MTEATAAVTQSAPPATAARTILGTLHYMAPEQLEGKDPDDRADIWAFGCLVYEMLTARRPFEGRSHASLLAAILTAEPCLSNSDIKAPPSLVRVVQNSGQTRAADELRYPATLAEISALSRTAYPAGSRSRVR